MKTNYLFPHKAKGIGWALFVPGLILGITFLIMDISSIEFFQWKILAIYNDEFMDSDNSGWLQLIQTNVLDELISILIIIGGLLVAFSKGKEEDEFISQMRLESLVWATYLNYLVLALSIAFVYGGSFLTIMTINMFTILIFFIVRFNWMLSRSSKSLSYEE